ncbi:hydroxyacylglutathione hydrolase [Kordiimonas sp. SCSIO 12610]|uniref:hydroxyacylglutathione hydrolase n=1 Tax=Kordiimonas sp. SCSIO 12610 TaxID=2829597 RepID=UPI00210A1CB8|nr:hydroxyacylglutathione hydrolase [Kordiimonas sp. SCSIO 12610]UTW55960.1 hydroxyacylglutathione hydrolase [Kordiimonas sp. SCSIO 12610]
MLEIVQIPVLNDNYLYLLHDQNTGDTAIVDPAVDEPVFAELEKRGWSLTHIINTHHHWDHTGANLALKEKYGLKIIGPKAEAERIPGIDLAVGDGDTINIGNSIAAVFDTPGHTSGHIVYHFEHDKALFAGDTIFAMGCGRLFEGTAAQMWDSLSKIMALPDDTRIFCAHEYTMANAKFALSVEPENRDLIKRVHEVEHKRAAGLPTIPTCIEIEKKTNPFLRPMSEHLQETIGMAGRDIVDIFAETRRLKDNF